MSDYSLSDITIILPTYKRFDKFKVTLESYIKNSPQEIIVVDDYSQCGYEDYIVSLNNPKIKLLTHPQNLGSPVARQTGLKEVKTNLVFMGEDDVVLPENYLLNLLEVFNKESLDVIASRLLQMVKKDESFEEALSRCDGVEGPFLSMKSLNSNFEVQDLYQETPFLHACSLFKIKILEKINYVNYEGNAFREETDFYFQCYQKGFKCAFSSCVCAFHMFHDDEGGHGSLKKRSPLKYHFVWPVYNNNKFLNKYWLEIAKLTNLRSKILCKYKFAQVAFLSYLHIEHPSFFKFLKKILLR